MSETIKVSFLTMEPRMVCVCKSMALEHAVNGRHKIFRHASQDLLMNRSQPQCSAVNVSCVETLSFTHHQMERNEGKSTCTFNVIYM